MPHSNRENISVLKERSFNEEDLSAITEEHPYYSIAQFRLLLHHKKNQHKNFERQASVTSLFFNNQKWLNWQLSPPKNSQKSDEAVAVSLENIAEKADPITIAESKVEELPAFEPLYTIDYFASQGIKISEESLANDKLGTQLKSFTEWLRSMKKIHTEKSPESEEQTDKIIQHLAENSNVNTTIITEAMAEVLLKQGKVEQAIEIYKKLSLNYPAGSAYFAAKINSLKPV